MRPVAARPLAMRLATMRLLALGITLALVPSLAAGQNLVVNPGFELGASNVGGSSGANIAGYAIDNGGTYPPGCEDDENIAYSFNRRSGNYGLQFGGSGCVNGIVQNIATTVGTTYNIDFYVRNAGVGSSTAQDMTFTAMFGANTIFNGFLAGSTSYTHLAASFVGTSTMTGLRFLSRNDNSFTYLDDITVTAEPPVTTTPEPATVALVALGLAALGPLVRRRSR